MNLRTILEQAIAEKASDVFIVSGLPVSFRKDGVIGRINDEKLLPPETESLLTEIYQHVGNRDLNILSDNGNDAFSYYLYCNLILSAISAINSELVGFPFPVLMV